MPTNLTTATDREQIQELLDGWTRAIQTRNPDGLASGLASNAILFDVINPLQYPGAVRQRAEQWLAQFQGAVGFEMKDLEIVAGEDVAFSHSLNHVNGATRDNRRIDMWWRSTVGYRKLNGKWTVVHEHNSVPFDMESGKASLDLKP